MKAIEITKAGGPEVLALVDVARPEPKAGEILIEVHYAGVNRPDCLQRAGLYNPPADASPLPGLEVSGVIAALGAGVSGWAVGDPVCALVAGGGYAEYVTCRADHALPVPDGMGLREAACLPETCYTVWSNVVMRGGLTAGEVADAVHHRPAQIRLQRPLVTRLEGIEPPHRRDHLHQQVGQGNARARGQAPARAGCR